MSHVFDVEFVSMFVWTLLLLPMYIICILFSCLMTISIDALSVILQCDLDDTVSSCCVRADIVEPMKSTQD